MNLKEKVIELQMQFTGEECEIEDMYLTIITKYQIFEPCQYLAEDEDWVNVTMTSIENENITQAMSINKSEIVMFAIFDRDEIQFPVIETNPEDFYQ